MEIFNTRVTPYVRIDYDLCIVEVVGRSCPKNSQEFYEPILSQIINFNPKHRELYVKFNLEYVNTSSYKWLFLVCKQLSNLNSQGYMLNANWCYEIEDDDMRQIGEEFSILSGLNFSFQEMIPADY